jgi:hypothetical protein
MDGACYNDCACYNESSKKYQFLSVEKRNRKRYDIRDGKDFLKKTKKTTPRMSK